MEKIKNIFNSIIELSDNEFNDYLSKLSTKEYKREKL